MTGSILFHFTDKDGIYGILKDNFKPSFAREDIKSNISNFHSQFAAPMVSFSDMRLDEVKEFQFPYGKFAIGLTKEWAVQNHLCAVMYVEQNSEYFGTYSKAILDFYEYLKTDSTENTKLTTIFLQLFGTIRYMKPYQAKLNRKEGEPIENYCFANEREWRYVLPLKDTDIPFLSHRQLNEKGKKYWNERVGNNKLIFSPKDIRYLIVPSDEDIIPLIRHIESVKDKFSYQEVQILQSRILTVNQIISDF